MAYFKQFWYEFLLFDMSFWCLIWVLSISGDMSFCDFVKKKAWISDRIDENWTIKQVKGWSQMGWSVTQQVPWFGEKITHGVQEVDQAGNYAFPDVWDDDGVVGACCRFVAPGRCHLEKSCSKGRAGGSQDQPVTHHLAVRTNLEKNSYFILIFTLG